VSYYQWQEGVTTIRAKAKEGLIKRYRGLLKNNTKGILPMEKKGKKGDSPLFSFFQIEYNFYYIARPAPYLSTFEETQKKGLR